MSYTLSHTSNKIISLTPVAHYDFTKLNLTIGTPISSVPSQTSGASLSSLDLSECPVMAENTLADGTTIRVASFSGAQRMFTTMDSPVMISSSDDVTMIVIATGAGGSVVSVWNRFPIVNYNCLRISSNSYNGYVFGNTHNIGAHARETYTHNKHLNFVEGQWSENGDGSNNYIATISTQMNMSTDTSRLSGSSSYTHANQWIGTTDDLIIGAHSYAATSMSNNTWYYYNGQVAEVLVFDGLLSDPDRQKVRDYVQEKYDIRRTGMVGSKCLQLDGINQYAVVDTSTSTRGSQLRTDYHTVTGGVYPGTKWYNQIFDFWLNIEEEHYPTSTGKRYAVLLRIKQGSYNTSGGNDYMIQADLHSSYIRFRSAGFGGVTIGDKYNFPKNRWMHVRLGVDYVSGRTHIWYDGVLFQTITDYHTSYYWNKSGITSVVFGEPSDPASIYAATDITDPSNNYSNAKMKVGGFRASYTAEPLSAGNFNPPTIQSLPDTTPGGDFTVVRDDMGLKPLYDKITTTENFTQYPKLHGKYIQTPGNVFGSYLYANSRAMPDLLDLSNPDLKSALRYCHVNLQHNQIRTLAPLRDVFESFWNPRQSYHFDVSYNQLTQFKDMKGSSFLNNGYWYNFNINTNPITSLEGIEELADCYNFSAHDLRSLKHIDTIDQANWERCAYFNMHSCPNLQTITPSAFKGLPQLDYISMQNNKNQTNAPVLQFDGVDQSNNYYYAYFYGCNITDFTPLKSDKLIRLDNYNQKHSNIIDMDWLSDCELLWEWNGSSNDYNLSNLPDFTNTRLNRLFLYHTNITDLTFLTTAIKGLRPAGNTFVLGVSSDTDAIYDTLHIYNCSLSASHMSTLGADPTKRISIVDELNASNNPELRDLRVFENSFNYPQRTSWHNHSGHHFAYINHCNLTNDSFSIGAMREWWQCLRLYIDNNPNLTSLSHLFTNNTSIPRSTYYDTRSFRELYVDSCNITDVSWMLNDSFAGVETIYLRYNPIDHPAFQQIATALAALKTSGQIRLQRIYLNGTTWDQKHWGGGWWYLNYPTHSHTIKNASAKWRTPTGEIGSDGWVYTASLTAAEYFRCTNDGSGTSLSVQAQTAKTIHDAGIDMHFSGQGGSWNHATQGTHYSPHTLPSNASQWGSDGWTCPIPYPPSNA